MANEQALAHLTAAETNMLDAVSHIRAAKVALGGEVIEPGPEPEPGPGPGGYELQTVGRTWRLKGTVPDWTPALVFPVMSLDPPGFTAARIALEIEIGSSFDGLHCFIDLIEDAGKWKGDHAILVNRGDNGAIAVSHTLEGKETQPVRRSLPLAAGQRLSFVAQLANGVWTVTAGTASVQMPTPALQSYQLKLQLGQPQDEHHMSNAGWKLLSCVGEVS